MYGIAKFLHDSDCGYFGSQIHRSLDAGFLTELRRGAACETALPVDPAEQGSGLLCDHIVLRTKYRHPYHNGNLNTRKIVLKQVIIFRYSSG